MRATAASAFPVSTCAVAPARWTKIGLCRIIVHHSGPIIRYLCPIESFWHADYGHHLHVYEGILFLSLDACTD